ncbi:MAG: nucleotide exchange factor GrpE [Crocinitomicaceae bacterium]|nr:nucleotide exchange factor GrpE [Crocinitomicaceae bacterium]
MAKKKKEDTVEMEGQEQDQQTVENTKAQSDNSENKDEAKSPIEELEIQVKEANDKYVRLYSDFDNFRKRTIKEKAELIQNASEKVISEMLVVLDDFERAINNTQDQEQVEGIKLIKHKMESIFERQGLKKMESKGQKFDMDLHEAITEIPAPEDSLKGCVVDVVEEGYFLNDKVIRFAKVVVGK